MFLVLIFYWKICEDWFSFFEGNYFETNLITIFVNIFVCVHTKCVYTNFFIYIVYIYILFWDEYSIHTINRLIFYITFL